MPKARLAARNEATSADYANPTRTWLTLEGPTRTPVDETRPRTSKPSTIGDSGAGSSAASGDSQGSDSAAKSTAASGAKRRSKTQAQGADADPGGSKKDDKKKGGFLRVFKKIFGHG